VEVGGGALLVRLPGGLDGCKHILSKVDNREQDNLMRVADHIRRSPILLEALFASLLALSGRGQMAIFVFEYRIDCRAASMQFYIPQYRLID
jgi:hypothetical protein